MSTDIKDTSSEMLHEHTHLGLPSKVLALSNEALEEMIEKYPYFSLLHSLKTARRQHTLVLQNQEYDAPKLVADSVYSWYKLCDIAYVQVQSGDVQVAAQDFTEGVAAYHVSDENQEVAFSPASSPTEVEPASYDQVFNERQIIFIQRFFKADRIRQPSLLTNQSYTIKEFSTALYTQWVCRITQPKELGQEDRRVVDTSIETLSDTVTKLDIPTPELRQVTEEPQIQQKNRKEELSETISDKPKKEGKIKKKHLVQELVAQSIADKELLISEPFALLLVSQGYIDKAIKVFEKLIEKNPAKSHIFAAQIEKLNKSK